MQHKSPIMVIMGKGMGKSLTFMMSALTSTGVTVVVVPLLRYRKPQGLLPRG
jgi:superfamily II DNA helicase RecQ